MYHSNERTHDFKRKDYLKKKKETRAVLVRQLFPKFSSFFFQEKQETFQKFGNLTEGEIFGTLRIPIFGKTNGKYGSAKIAKKKESGNVDKSPPIRTVLIFFATMNFYFVRPATDTWH